MEKQLGLQLARQERIANRKAKVHARLLALTQDDSLTASGAKAEEEVEEVSFIQARVTESKGVVDSEKQEDLDELGLVQLRAKERENVVEDSEVNARQALMPRRLRNSEWSLTETAAHAERWEALPIVTTPHAELKEALRQQQLESLRITGASDSLAAEMWEGLKQKDEAFVHALQQQASETDELLQVLARQSAELQAACSEQLRAAEAAFIQEEAEATMQRNAEIDRLMAEQTAAEELFLDSYVETIREYQAQLRELRLQDADGFNELKLKLEVEVQELERHLEAMKATYALNEDKLAYNEHVLRERAPENQFTITHQKRKLASQREILVALKQRYAASEKQYTDANLKLTEQYKRIAERVNQQQEKHRLFQQKDAQRFQEVQDMKCQAVDELVNTITILQGTLTGQPMEQKLLAAGPERLLTEQIGPMLDKPLPDLTVSSSSVPWAMVESKMEEYLSVLKERAACAREVQDLQRSIQNVL